jgi:hypothetical protein
MNSAESFEEIDDNLLKLVGDQQDVKSQLHVGGGWYVSVTSGFSCVDIWKFQLKPGVGVKCTKADIALRLHEWSRLKKATRKIEKNQKVADAQPSLTSVDHFINKAQ